MLKVEEERRAFEETHVVESVGPSLFLGSLGIPAAYQLKDVIVFTILVLILIFRSQSFLGGRLAEKKA